MERLKESIYTKKDIKVKSRIILTWKRIRN